MGWIEGAEIAGLSHTQTHSISLMCTAAAVFPPARETPGSLPAPGLLGSAVSAAPAGPSPALRPRPASAVNHREVGGARESPEQDDGVSVFSVVETWMTSQTGGGVMASLGTAEEPRANGHCDKAQRCAKTVL